MRIPMHEYKTLTATCSVRRGTGKCRFVTWVTIHLGPLTVAEANLGGIWTAAAALAEFRRNLPKRFVQCNGYGAAKALGLAA